MIIDYRIVTERNLNTMIATVQAAIAVGWQPLGGLTINGIDFIQAMVQYEEEVYVG